MSINEYLGEFDNDFGELPLEGQEKDNDLLIKKLSRAIDMSGSMVLILDQQGRVTNLNQKYELFTGKNFENLIGKPIQDFDEHFEYLPLDEIQNLVALHEVWRGEVPVKNKDGHLVLCRTVVSPIRDEDTGTVSVVVILDDVTQDKDKDIQFMELKKMLSEQEKLASIGSMLTGIIHEINNPLAYIDTNMYALEGIIREMKLPETVELLEMKDIVKDMKIGVSHIKEISASLKRMVFKGLHEEEEYFDINEEIETVLNVAKNEYKYYAVVEFSKEVDLYITGYPSGIRQVMLNLLINATYAIRKKYEHALGHVSIKSYREKRSIVVEVIDDGIGIPEEIRSKIFTTLFTTKKKGEGTGLGLSISKAIIEDKHGGTLTFTSIEGEGTTFKVVLPERFNHGMEEEQGAEF